MALRYVKEKTVRDFAKSKGKRVGHDFFVLIDKFIESKVEKACAVKNGSKKTLDADVAKFVGL